VSEFDVKAARKRIDASDPAHGDWLGDILERACDRIEALEAELHELRNTDTAQTIRLWVKSHNDLEARCQRCREALERIRDELGVPQPGYPAPVANAAEIAREALRETD